jgi:DNA-binding NtrC family response regulator
VDGFYSARAATNRGASLDGFVTALHTDVNMPGGIDGIMLAICIRRRWPTIQIIITSGRPWPVEAVVPADVVFFAKPYRQDRVLDTVRKMAA